MRSPCGTTFSTSTPPQRRRASPPPPPPHREWEPLSCHSPGAELFLWVVQRCWAGAITIPRAALATLPSLPWWLWVQPHRAWLLQVPGSWGNGQGSGWAAPSCPHSRTAGAQCHPCCPQAAQARVLAVPAAVLPVRHLAAETQVPGGGEPEAPYGGEQSQLTDAPQCPPMPCSQWGDPSCPRGRREVLPVMLSPANPLPQATNIATETCQYEDQEQQLMIDCVEQFSEASQQVVHLSEELAHRAEDAARQQEEITQLLAQVAELQQKCRTYGSEVEELQQHLTAAKEVQQQLRMELRDLQEKYAECGGMLQEAQEEVKSLRSRSMPNSTVSRYSAASLLPVDSLAAEIKGMMRKRTDSSSSDYKSYQRVFETVKAVNQTAKARSCSESPHHVPGSKQLSAAHSGGASTPHTNCSGSEGARAEGASEDSRAAPGRQDLEAAVQRLSVRQQSHVSEERSFFEAERERKLWRLRDGASSSGFLTPEGSIVSTGTNYSGGSELTAGSSFSLGSLTYLPDKLQIVKPLEGSVTLHHWQQLAQPNLGGILVPRPGVLTKDFRQLDIDLEEVYSLNDLEEDDVDASSFQLLPTSTPAKAKERPRVFLSVNNLPQTPSTFTITTCHILHPTTALTTVTPSLYHAVVPSCGPFEGLSLGSPSPEQTPPTLALGPGPPSTPMGLFRLLLGRDSHLAPRTGSWLAPSLHSQDPQNSEPHPSPVPRGQDGPAPRSSIFSWNLVEKLQRLGLDKVVARGETSYTRPGLRGAQGSRK
uniref:Huntingtin associated protein 1 n=1 Tax=Corvus moneduloides TaxID=1196302 RepID=A0A8U7NNZ3_CORMO